MTAVDQTLTRTDEKEKLQEISARMERYEAIETPLLDTECSKVCLLLLVELSSHVCSYDTILIFPR